MIRFCPASGSLRLSEARTVSQLSTRWQPNWSRAQQASSDRYFPTNVPSLVVAVADSGRAQEKSLDHYIMTIQKSHKMLRCPAKLQSVVAKFSGQIFTKIKFLILFSLRSFLLPLHSFFFKISTQFPMSRQIFLYLGVVPKWPRNLKNLF